ncbi:MAG: HAMP domain-containing histidine kinase [Planctomycetes bacterium]|nr:HAMP domain-containing histidine kinase [Planctomycetota bacterium]MCB9917530.1 HAMP domain-containing histidine kinase [Planctomycetota bacterium]
MRKRIEVHDARSLEQALATVKRARITLNFSWLLKLRWAAVLGQLLAIAVVHYLIGVHLPRLQLLGIVLIATVSNIGLVWWFRRSTRSGAWDNLETSSEFLIGSIMTLDLFLLTGMLHVTGGASNPFTIFYIVNCTLSAVVLRPLWGWVHGIVACFCYAGLFYGSSSLEQMVAASRGNDGYTSLLQAWELHLVGMFVAFATASGILLYFFSRVFVELARLEEELLVMRQRHSKGQRLEAMATLAAGAAHELSSPLSTIAVIAKELERDASTPGVPPTMLEDTKLIREEVKRCRRILDRMSADAGESAGEALVRIEVRSLFDEIVSELPAKGRVQISVDAAIQHVSYSLPPVALSQALRGIVQNALDASAADQHVDLSAEPTGDEGDGLRILVRDRGAGMEADTLERVGTPFFTTKEVGSGTGLGIFLARTVVERLGGALWIESTPKEGTLVSIEMFSLDARSGTSDYDPVGHDNGARDQSETGQQTDQ